MSNIVLSAGIRSNLLALQQNSADQDVVNSALSTGKKVNTALDDPLKYFTAQNFDNRGAELGALLDNIGLGINTIKQANDGITALQNTIQTLQAQLRNALQNQSTNAKLASGSNTTNGQLINWGPDYTGTYPSLLTTGAPPGPFSVGATFAVSATNQLGATLTLTTAQIGTANFVTAANTKCHLSEAASLDDHDGEGPCGLHQQSEGQRRSRSEQEQRAARPCERRRRRAHHHRERQRHADDAGRTGDCRPTYVDPRGHGRLHGRQ